MFLPEVERICTGELGGSGLKSGSTITSRVTLCNWINLWFDFLICKYWVKICKSLECTGLTKTVYVKCMQCLAWNTGGLPQSSLSFPSLPSLSSYPVSALRQHILAFARPSSRASQRENSSVRMAVFVGESVVCTGLAPSLGCRGQWGCRQPSALLAREIDSQPSWHLLLALGKHNYSL